MNSGIVAKVERFLLPCIDGVVWILEGAHYEVAIEFPTHASHFRSSHPTFSIFVIKTKYYTISNFLFTPGWSPKHNLSINSILFYVILLLLSPCIACLSDFHFSQQLQ